MSWNVLEDGAVLWREYEFSRGAYATTMVFRGKDGLVVISPGTGLEARDYDELREHGEVRALIANNAFHTLGQRPWRQHFPEAESYAPRGALADLGKKAPEIPYRALSALPLPDGVHCDDPPGFKSGETIARVKTKRGWIWYSGDLLTNIQRMPGPPVRWFFTLTGSAPGFRLFKPAVWFFVKDKKALKQWSLDTLEKQPPAVVVPAHGPAFDPPDVAAEARAQLEKM
jgi:hypothetical protein